MKYIRTKDGKIFEYAGKERTPYGDLISVDGTHYRYDCVLKEADTIEELCDYVIRKPFGSVDDRPFILKTIIHKGYLDRNNYEEVREVLRQQHRGQEKGDEATIYLAIPTSSGITYVAKLNSKGELELL